MFLPDDAKFPLFLAERNADVRPVHPLPVLCDEHVLRLSDAVQGNSEQIQSVLCSRCSVLLITCAIRDSCLQWKPCRCLQLNIAAFRNRGRRLLTTCWMRVKAPLSFSVWASPAGTSHCQTWFWKNWLLIIPHSGTVWMWRGREFELEISQKFWRKWKSGSLITNVPFWWHLNWRDAAWVQDKPSRNKPTQRFRYEQKPFHVMDEHRRISVLSVIHRKSAPAVGFMVCDT